MKKSVFILLGLAVILAVGCDDSSGFSDKPVQAEQQKDFASDENIGRTVEMFERALSPEEEERINKEKDLKSKAIRKDYQDLIWEDLIAPGYDADSIMEKYAPLINTLEHGSDDALALYRKMEAEFSQAPANNKLGGKAVSIPGFIAPLEQKKGMITEFLLVPYFGACIHLPPPPSNQTVYVKIAKGYEINLDDSYAPVWVSGDLIINNTATEIGSASYQVSEALISEYVE